jgi:hypothetical protein
MTDVLKVSIKGEVFSFDETRYPMAEAIQIEKALDVSFGKYQEMLAGGYASAASAFTWAVLHRNGRDVPLADILNGTFELDTADVDIKTEGETEGEGVPGPTGPSSTSTSGDGSPPSPPRSDTRRSKSAS